MAGESGIKADLSLSLSWVEAELGKTYMVGWMDDSFRKYCHFVAPSYKLELARFSILLRIQDEAECGNS